ncbi:MAG TPA: amidophosphoribosyltransferase [Acidimicrobiales bacterium]|nr:amidophosphoribosyltransferase [Acidimicrobiales bacterium]
MIASPPHRPAIDADHPREACGVVGVHARGPVAVARLTYLGLFALQHRGQEAAGMAVSDGDTLTVVKDQGLVASVFDDRTLAGLTGHLAIGHCRYSTTGSSTWRNAQPAYRSVGEQMFALGHNGNLVNTEKLAADAGMLEGTVTSDSDLVAELIAAELSIDVAAEELADLGAPVVRGDDGPRGRLERAVASVVPRLEGAYSFVIMDEARVIGVRDPNGFRPLCLGRLDARDAPDTSDTAGDGPGGWVLASETPALDIVGATFVRELEPGEMVVIDDAGVRSLHPHGAHAAEPRLCLFEFVYFARPDSRLYGQSVHQARIRMGEQLAEQAPVDADMVMGVPESGVPAAEGFARRSGIPLGQGLVKNRYIGRSFIAPSQEMRAQAVRMKLNPLRENIDGKRLVVVDDSIVRGTTQKQLVRMLREAGAREVHLRITSPPVAWSCFYGIDTGDRDELIAAHLDVDEIRSYLSLDTLAYLTLERLVEATGAPGAGFCDACFTGDYPVPVPVTLRKHVLEPDGRPLDRHVQPALDGTVA